MKYSKQSLNSVIRCCISYQMAFRWKEVEVAVKRLLVDDDDEERVSGFIREIRILRYTTSLIRC